MTPRHFRLGTRGSLLAQWQANWVASQLQQHGVPVELVNITTSGDRQQAAAAPLVGTGVFTKEIQRELLAGRIDLAVHSLKDLPTERSRDWSWRPCLSGRPWPTCWSPRVRFGRSLAARPAIGTGSFRRRATAPLPQRPGDARHPRQRRYPPAQAREGHYEAIILAQAGLER